MLLRSYILDRNVKKRNKKRKVISKNVVSHKGVYSCKKPVTSDLGLHALCERVGNNQPTLLLVQHVESNKHRDTTSIWLVSFTFCNRPFKGQGKQHTSGQCWLVSFLFCNQPFNDQQKQRKLRSGWLVSFTFSNQPFHDRRKQRKVGRGWLVSFALCNQPFHQPGDMRPTKATQSEMGLAGITGNQTFDKHATDESNPR